MHQAALLGESLKDAEKYGWAVPENVTHDWYAVPRPPPLASEAKRQLFLSGSLAT
jgi:hypothetical protein